MAITLRQRQVHLDFHTSPFIPDVGADFDAAEFAAQMQRAHVNSVTVFAKCHHGHLYYQTDHPARHPGLKQGLDLTASQVDALHAAGIRARGKGRIDLRLHVLVGLAHPPKHALAQLHMVQRGPQIERERRLLAQQHPARRAALGQRERGHWWLGV